MLKKILKLFFVPNSGLVEEANKDESEQEDKHPEEKPMDESPDSVSGETILYWMEHFKGNKIEVARHLNIKYSRLIRELDKLEKNDTEVAKRSPEELLQIWLEESRKDTESLSYPSTYSEFYFGLKSTESEQEIDLSTATDEEIGDSREKDGFTDVSLDDLEALLDEEDFDSQDNKELKDDGDLDLDLDLEVDGEDDSEEDPDLSDLEDMLDDDENDLAALEYNDAMPLSSKYEDVPDYDEDNVKPNEMPSRKPSHDLPQSLTFNFEQPCLKWLDGGHLMDRWGMDAFEILHLIFESGMPAWDSYTLLALDPKKMDVDDSVRKDIVAIIQKPVESQKEHLKRLRIPFPFVKKFEEKYGAVLETIQEDLTESYFVSFQKKEEFSIQESTDENGRKTTRAQKSEPKAKRNDDKLFKKGRYEFYSAGPGWVVCYDGRPLKAMKGKGFQYIHFLVERKRKQFHTDEIAAAFSSSSNPIQDPTAANQVYDDQLSTGSCETLSRHELIDDKAKAEFELEKKRLQEALRDAEESDDPLIKMEAERELERFLAEYDKVVGKGGKIRNFSDKSEKDKASITKAIERALKSIKKHDEEAYQHFHSALKPINDFNQCYNPQEDIEWHLG